MESRTINGNIFSPMNYCQNLMMRREDKIPAVLKVYERIGREILHIRATFPTAPTPPHPPWCRHPNNIWQEIQIIAITTTKFSQNSSHPLRLNFEPSSSALHSRASSIHVYLVNLFKVSTTISWKISCQNVVAQQNYVGQVRPGPRAVGFQHKYSINCWALSVLTGIQHQYNDDRRGKPPYKTWHFL